MSASDIHDRPQPGNAAEDRFKRKDRLLFMVGRLNDKDMQITAARELREAAQVLANAPLLDIIPQICVFSHDVVLSI